MTMKLTAQEQFQIVYQDEIKAIIGQYVRGQEEVVDLVSYIGHLYTAKLYGWAAGNVRADLPKLNLLLTGPTGFGKTFLIKKLAEALKLPYLRIDCSSISAEGYKGVNLSTILASYVEMSPHGAGIIHLDEFDKMGAYGQGGSGEIREYKLNLQQGLLDLLDGEYGQKSEDTKTNTTSINNSLIILTGSFQSRRDAAESKKSIGFVAQTQDVIEEGVKSWKEHLIESGFLHEFASRIIASIELAKYTDEQIKDIILNSKESSYVKYHRMFGAAAALDEDKINEVVKQVSESKNGLRDLDSIMFDTFYKKRSL